MSQSPFVKLCKKCSGSGETGDISQRLEVCDECNGAKYVVDYGHLEIFKHKVWEVSSKEIAPYISLVREVDKGINSIMGLPAYPKAFLSQLYYIRAQLFEFIAALDNAPAYALEAVRSLRISHELLDSKSEGE